MNNDGGKTAHIEIVQNPDVIDFLKSCSFMREPTGEEVEEIINSFVTAGDFSSETLPENLITVNSSSYEAHAQQRIWRFVDNRSNKRRSNHFCLC